jgi:hypothetical protein
MVEDSGKGIAEGDLAHVFEPFFSTKPEGLGMGLSISRSIVQAHGGRIWATIMHPGIGWELLRKQHIELRSEKYLAAASALESAIADLKEFQELCRPTKPTTELERRDPNREKYLRFWRSTAGEMVKMRDTMKYLRRRARMSQEHGR